MNGSKVADNYGDFYDDTWDDETNRRHQNGAVNLFPIFVWTGSDSDGTGAAGDELGPRQRSKGGSSKRGEEERLRDRFRMVQ